jgi:tRNA A37 threonylcarbamoyladenosine modification protein TsaB
VVLLIHHHGDQITVGAIQNRQIIGTRIIGSRLASKLLAVTIQSVLDEHIIEMTNLKGCIVSNGPSAASAQRSLFATVNGFLSAARLNGISIPLVSIDGFEALYQEYNAQFFPPSLIAVWNAHSDELFYLFQATEKKYNRGILGREQLISLLKTKFTDTKELVMIGTLTDEQSSSLQQELSCQIMKNIVAASLDTIMVRGLQLLHTAQESSTYVLPLYTKQHIVERNNANIL